MRLWNQPNASPHVKDAFHSYLVNGQAGAVNPDHTGTKAAAHFVLDIQSGSSATVQLRLTTAAPDAVGIPFGKGFDQNFAARRREADAFYDEVTPDSLSPDAQLVMRQALAGMLWSKQHYYFDLDRWLEEHRRASPARVKEQERAQCQLVSHDQ